MSIISTNFARSQLSLTMSWIMKQISFVGVQVELVSAIAVSGGPDNWIIAQLAQSTAKFIQSLCIYTLRYCSNLEYLMQMFKNLIAV